MANRLKPNRPWTVSGSLAFSTQDRKRRSEDRTACKANQAREFDGAGGVKNGQRDPCQKWNRFGRSILVLIDCSDLFSSQWIPEGRPGQLEWNSILSWFNRGDLDFWGRRSPSTTLVTWSWLVKQETIFSSPPVLGINFSKTERCALIFWCHFVSCSTRPLVQTMPDFPVFPNPSRPDSSLR